jgi:hypothetical protein
VNASPVRLQSKHINNAKTEVRFKQLFNAYFENKFKFTRSIFGRFYFDKFDNFQMPVFDQ